MPDQSPYPIDEPAATPAPAPSGPGKPRIDKPGVMEGFEEDADFTKDPELDRVILGDAAKPLHPSVVTTPADAKPEFVRAYWAWEDKFWAGVGVILLIGALIASGVNVYAPAGQAVPTMRRVWNVLLSLYETLLHTGTGVAAVFFAAMLLGQRMGRVEVAVGRMFAAVAAFVFVFSLNFTLTTGKFEETAAAAIAYLAVVACSFRLFKRDPLMYVVGGHFAIWLVVQVGMALAAAAAKGG